MPAKMKFKTKEEAPEDFREHLEQVDGGFELAVVAKKVHDGFRQTNIDLLKERDGLKAENTGLRAVVGEDPEKFKGELVDLRSTAQKVKDGTLKTSDAIETEVVKRVGARESGWTDEKRQLTSQLEQAQSVGKDWESKFRSERLNNEVSALVSAADSGFNPSAVSDIQARARGVFVVQDDGSLLPKKGDGVIYSKKEAGVPMSLKEWGAGLLEEAPHFGKSSAGGGANGGGNGGEKVAGMARTDFEKLSPSERITLHRKAQAGH